MKRIYIYLSFLILIGNITLAQAQNTALPIMKTKPYLQRPTPDGITITWVTNSLVHSWVEYGEDPTLLDKKAQTLVDGQVVCYNRLHKIRLNDLKPNTKYYYKAISREITLYQAYKKEFGETETTPLYSFTTPSDASTDFTAIVMNDLHKNKETLKNLMDQVKNFDYDFVLFNGDCIDDPSNEETVLDYLTYMNEQVKAEEHPIFLLRGNHEIRNAYSIRLRDYIDYVGGDNSYGSFNWGDTRFVLLDCGEDKPDDHWVYYGLNDFDSFRKDQVKFLEEEFKTECFQKATKRILIHHIPIYSCTDKYQPCRDLWHPLLNNAPFDIALNGHVHQYKYTYVGEDINTFPTIIGGGPNKNTATIIVLDKKGNNLTVTVISDNGEELLKLNL